MYNILFAFGFALLLPHFLLRMRRRGGYRRGFGQRLAWYDAATRAALGPGGRIWVHAVSVGELFIALRFMREYRDRCPEARFLLTTTTSTGFSLAEKQLPPGDPVLYFPVDAPGIMRRVLRLLQPSHLVLVEYELWPNLIRLCHRQGVPVSLINGRLSERSYRGYRKVNLFTRRLLPMVEHFCMQGDEDARRIRELGALPDRVHVIGSAKYEVADREPAAEERVGAVLQSLDMGPNRLVLLGGSTWPGEEAILLRTYVRLRGDIPDLRLILVPRHVERAADVIETIEKSGCTYCRRSQVTGSEPSPGTRDADVLFVDTTGELRHFYAHADVIFVGKSLCRTEGQNIVEAAAYGKPVVVGPRLDNFESIVRDFQQAEAFCQVQDEAEFEARVRTLLQDRALRQQMGDRAAALVREQSGAVGRTLDILLVGQGVGAAQ